MTSIFKYIYIYCLFLSRQGSTWVPGMHMWESTLKPSTSRKREMSCSDLLPGRLKLWRQRERPEPKGLCLCHVVASENVRRTNSLVRSLGSSIKRSLHPQLHVAAWGETNGCSNMAIEILYIGNGCLGNIHFFLVVWISRYCM